jgi:hypothetical protein
MYVLSFINVEQELANLRRETEELIETAALLVETKYSDVSSAAEEMPNEEEDSEKANDEIL